MMLDEKLKIQKFNDSGPYYSSYPTLSEWSHEITSEEYSGALEAIVKKRDNSKTGLYIHFPFCQKQCLYCACNAVITSDEQRINHFQELLFRELDMLSDILANNDALFSIKEIHLGGGSPSMLSNDAFENLIAKLFQIIQRSDVKEFCIEVDPRTATQEKFAQYKKSGVTRLSFGVQEFSPDVQKAINRIQPFELLQSLLTDSIRRDFTGINFDILYGLPLQTYQSFMDTIQKVIELAPDRITLIRYAHIPESRPHQRVLNNYPMPDSTEKTSMFFSAAQAFKDAGWEHVGIDHFALPGDSLAIAARNGTIKRNFGGYSAADIDTIIGVGPTATMRIGALYVQNTYSHDKYEEALTSGRFPVNRGYHLNPDDRLRRDIIDSILCSYRVDLKYTEEQHGIQFSEYFSEELPVLQSLVLEGIIELSEKELLITSEGRFFLRHVCRVFDRFLQGGKPYYVVGP